MTVADAAAPGTASAGEPGGADERAGDDDACAARVGPRTVRRTAPRSRRRRRGRAGRSRSSWRSRRRTSSTASGTRMKVPCRITVEPKTPSAAAANGRWRSSRGSTAGRSVRSSTATKAASSGTIATAATIPSVSPGARRATRNATIASASRIRPGTSIGAGCRCERRSGVSDAVGRRREPHERRGHDARSGRRARTASASRTRRRAGRRRTGRPPRSSRRAGRTARTPRPAGRAASSAG